MCSEVLNRNTHQPPNHHANNADLTSATQQQQQQHNNRIHQCIAGMGISLAWKAVGGYQMFGCYKPGEQIELLVGVGSISIKLNTNFMLS